MIEYVHNLIHWDEYKDKIQRALDNTSCGENGINDIYNKIQNGKMGLIDIHGKAAAVIEFMEYPQLNALRVTALGGDDMDEWLGDFIDFLYKWAAENNMNRIEHLGRKGWGKKLIPYGYKEKYIFMTKDIDYG